VVALATVEPTGVHAAVLEFACRAAWAWVIATELFDQLFFTVHDALPALDSGFGWEAPATFTAWCETSWFRCLVVWTSQHTSAGLGSLDQGASVNEENAK
jgi:hypothetical protein